jgi:hypothetical protein
MVCHFSFIDAYRFFLPQNALPGDLLAWLAYRPTASFCRRTRCRVICLLGLHTALPLLFAAERAAG